MVTIKDNKGNIIMAVNINEGSKRKFMLQHEDYITLKFSLDEPIYFPLGAKVEIENDPTGLFEVTDLYSPTYNNENGGYDYELKLDAYYYKWKNKIFKHIPEHGGREASWNLTANLDVYLNIFLRNLESHGYTFKDHPFRYVIDDTVDKTAKLLQYDNTNMIDALTKMAEAWECEWWVENDCIYFGKCRIGDDVIFELGTNVEAMSKNDIRSTYATRIYAFGSTRNITTNYRHIDSSMVVNGVVQKRLMLPIDTPFIDAQNNLTEEEAIESVVVFEDIYPKRISEFVGAGTKQYVDTIDDTNGKKEVKWIAYRYRDNSLNFKDKYIIQDKVLKITFQSGSLNGMEFEVIFNPDKVAENSTDSQLWEIVRNEDYGRPLPDAVLFPKNGDKFILHGFDISLVDDSYITQAEQELKEAATKYVAKTKEDPSIYECSMMSEIDNIYSIGQRVKLINRAYFQNFRSSRIIGFELNLDIPWDSPKYFVGENLQYSRLGELEDKIEKLTYNGAVYSGGGNGGTNIYVISSIDKSAATDRNVLSAKRSYKDFLSKTSEDVAQKLITFLEGVLIGNEGYRLRPNGDAVLGKITSLVYDAVTQRGFGIEKRENGYKLSITDIEVWGKAIFNNLELRKLSYVGGNYSFSPAGSKIVYIKWIDAQGNITTDINQVSAFRCYMATDDGTTTTRNLWEVGDQVRCQEFDIKEGNHHGTSNRNYWRLVVGKSSEAEELTDIMGTPIYTDKKFEWIDLSKSDASTPTDDFPKAGDTIVARGNRNNPLRQGFIDINTHGENAPSIVVYSGVNSYQLNDDNVTALLSPSDIRLSAEKLKMLSSDGRFTSFLEMTRNEISLSLKDFGGSNLLHGSSFMGELPPLNDFSQVFACNNAILGEDNGKKHQGRNYLAINQTGQTEDMYSGIFHCVDVEPGGTYTASVWMMSDDVSSIDAAGFAIEIVRMIDGERVQPDATLAYSYKKPKDNGVWERLAFTFSVPADISQIGVNFWMARNGRMYISEPQLERGTIATDWSEHPDDIKHQVQKAGINIKEGTLNLSGENIIISNSGNSEPTALFKDGKIKSSYIESTVLTTVPDERGCYTEIYENVFHLHGAKGKNGIKQYIDKDGMPHLVFYTPDGLPAFDMWWGNMVSLFPGLIQAHWEECFLMSVQGQNGLYVVQNKNADYKVYEYHASYNTSSKKYGEDGYYDMMLFVEKDVNSPTIPDGWYIKKTVYGWYSEVPIQPSISTIKWVGAVTLISVQNGKLQKINNKDYIVQYFDLDNGDMIDGKLGYMGKTFGDGIIK